MDPFLTSRRSYCYRRINIILPPAISIPGRRINPPKITIFLDGKQLLLYPYFYLIYYMFSYISIFLYFYISLFLYFSISLFYFLYLIKRKYPSLIYKKNIPLQLLLEGLRKGFLSIKGTYLSCWEDKYIRKDLYTS